MKAILRSFNNSPDAKTLPGILEAAEGEKWDEASQEAQVIPAVLRAIRAQIQ